MHKKLEIEPWGPAKLREIIKKLQDAINLRTPLASLTIDIDHRPDGSRIELKGTESPSDELEGSGATGGGNAAAEDPDVAFFLSDATTASGDPPVTSNKVFVADGKINGEFPSGMGSGEFTLDLDDPADSLIYAGITFNPTTLDINSRFIQVSGSGDPPESHVEDDGDGGGFLYWLLGFTFFDGDGAFRVTVTRLGNIDFAFTYGVLNSKPALLPVDSGPGWIDLDAIIGP